MEKNGGKDIEYDTLQNYELSAKKLIIRYSGKNAGFILKDNDRFGRIIETLILSDMEWNGKGSKYGYRKIRAKWAIANIFNESKSSNKNITEYDYMNNIPVEDNTIEVENNEIIDKIYDAIENSGLTREEKFCIDKYFLERNHSYRSIAKLLGCSRQKVSNKLKSAQEKIFSTYITS